MRLFKLLSAGCLSLLSLAIHAETLNGLYQVREPVSSQSPDERNQATQRALETLVLRLTGDPKALQSAGLAEVRKDPQQIISQYGYDAGPPESLQVDFRIVAMGQQSASDSRLVAERFHRRIEPGRRWSACGAAVASRSTASRPAIAPAVG